MIPTIRDRKPTRAVLVLLGLLCLVLTSVRAPLAAAQTSEPTSSPLDLPTLLQLVADQSHAASTAASDLAVAQLGVERNRAGWWPSVDLSGSYTMRDNPIEAQAGTFTFPTAEKNSGQYGIEARELLWDGGRRGLAVTTAAKQAEAVRLGGLAAVQQAQLGAVDAYLSTLELTGARQVLEQRLTALEEHHQTVTDLFEQGLTARNDLLETEVRVRAVQDQLAAVDDRQEVARQELNRRLGRQPDEALALPDSLPEPPALPASRPDLLQDALRVNAGLQAVTARQEVQESHLELARRAWYPSLFVGARHDFVQNQFLVHQAVNSLVAGIHWNIFDGGVRSADIKQAEARAAAGTRDRLETERQVTVALESAWRGWRQAGRELKTARANVAASLENLRIVEDQYRQGVARSSDVLDAETLLAQSRFDVVRRHYAAYRAQTQLLMVAGQDLAAFYSGGAGAAGKDRG